jgi:hypothetical protein
MIRAAEAKSSADLLKLIDHFPVLVISRLAAGRIFIFQV